MTSKKRFQRLLSMLLCLALCLTLVPMSAFAEENFEFRNLPTTGVTNITVPAGDYYTGVAAKDAFILYWDENIKTDGDFILIDYLNTDNNGYHAWTITIENGVPVATDGGFMEYYTTLDLINNEPFYASYDKWVNGTFECEPEHTHSYTNYVVTAATCTSYGVKAYYKCSCGKYYSDSECTKEITDLAAWKTGDGRIAKKDHAGGTATCTAKAKCSTCGAEYGSLAAHTFAWVIDKEATTTATGLKHEECTVCGYKEAAVTIDKLPAVHTHAGTKVNQVDATCTADGVKVYYKCSCGKYYTDSACTKEIADLTAWKSGDGKIAKINHSGGTATCEAKAKCSTCGAEYGSLAAHSSQDVAVIPATCTEKGKNAGIICAVCKTVLSGCEEVAAKGHTEVSANNAVAATCTKAGKESDTKCSVCGETITEGKEIKATGHKYNKGKITKAPTSAKKGVRTKKCTVCGNKKTVSVAKIAKTKLGKVSAKSKGFTVKWTKKTAATGYQIMYSTSKKFKSGNKKVTIKNAKTVSKTVKKLKAKKTYYVKVRCYKTIDGKKYYGAWTSAKKVITKR